MIIRKKLERFCLSVELHRKGSASEEEKEDISRKREKEDTHTFLE